MSIVSSRSSEYLHGRLPRFACLLAPESSHLCGLSNLTKIFCEVKLAAAQSIIFVGPGQYSLECGNDCRVELGLNSLCESEPCDTAGHGFAIGPVRCHRVVRIGHADDAGKQRNLLALDSVRVAVAVHAFVVVPNNPGDVRVVLYLREDSFSDLRVLLHLPSFVEGQGPRL